MQFPFRATKLSGVVRRVVIANALCVLLFSTSCSTGTTLRSDGVAQTQEILLWDTDASLSELELLRSKLAAIADSNIDVAVLQRVEIRLRLEAGLFKEWLISEYGENDLIGRRNAASRAESLRNAISALRLQVAKAA